MGAQRTSFEKLQRDRAKKAGGELSADELLTQIALIHKQLDDKTISFEEFEELKADLMARLPID